MIDRSAQNEADPSGIRPTRIRWRMIAILMAIMGITAACRLDLSIAIKPIQDEFGFSTLTTGWLFSAFLAGYAIFQIPWGYLGDRFGPRTVLTVSILAWSVLTALMGVAPRLAMGGLTVLSAFFIIRCLT
ncbi:MAG: MFS transporter, partial [Terriglobia bacterium]